MELSTIKLEELGFEITIKLDHEAAVDLPTLLDAFDRLVKGLGYYPNGHLEYNEDGLGSISDNTDLD